MKRGFEKIGSQVYVPILKRYLELLKEVMGEKLIGVILYGSVARGDADPSRSDIDVYIVARDWPRYFDARFKLLNLVLKSLKDTPEYRWALDHGIHLSFCEYPLTLEEASIHGPLDLEICEDGVILFERGNFLRKKFRDLKSKLNRLGSRRLWKPGIGHYWMLKPQVRFGELIEL